MDAVANDTSGRDHADVVLDIFRTQLWGVDVGADLETTIAAYAVHPITRALLDGDGKPKPLIKREGEKHKDPP